MVQRNLGLMGQYAGFVTRAIAIIIDILIVIVTVMVLTAAIRIPLEFFLGFDVGSCSTDVEWTQTLMCHAVNFFLAAIAILTAPIYFIFLSTAGGQTIGKYVMGVRVVRLDGKAMGYWRATLRYLGYFISILALGLGFLWVVIDDRRRGFHDKLAGTCVIYSWRAQQNQILLTRIQRFFGRVNKKNRVALMKVLATQPVELVTLAVPGFNELNDVLRIVNGGIQSGEFEIIGLQEYAKTADGQINQLDVDSMFAGVTNLVEFAEYGGLTPARVHQIKDELPNDHFALAVLIGEQEADKLVKLVARRTAAQIRRYELGTTKKGASQGADGERPRPASASDDLAPPAQVSVAVSAAPVTGVTPEPVTAVLSEERIAAPTSASVNGRPASEALVQDTSDILAALDELKRHQVALQEEVAAKSAALVDLQNQMQSTDAALSAALTSVEAERAALDDLRTNYAELAARQHRYPGLTQLDDQLAQLPAEKSAAINAAFTAQVFPQLVTAPQDLTAIKGIGPTFEQRLYQAGVGAFWEVAATENVELQRILALTDLQMRTVDLAAIRADAHRLAEATGTVGYLWQGEPPDDFEPIEGIGPVFEQRLYDAGIRTYAALAATTPEQLAQIVAAPKPSQPDYAGWIEQAQRLAGAG